LERKKTNKRLCNTQWCETVVIKAESKRNKKQERPIKLNILKEMPSPKRYNYLIALAGHFLLEYNKSIITWDWNVAYSPKCMQRFGIKL
jgi:hypothetical protein